MADTIISRAEAKAQGLLRYFTGKPCERGHVAERIISSYKCLECAREDSVAKRAADPEKARERDRQWREKSPEKVRANLARYRDAHRDRRNAESRARRSEPGPQRDARLARRRELRASRRDELNAKNKADYVANPERRREIAKRSYEKHIEKSRARNRKWREENSDKVSAYRMGPGRQKQKEWEKNNREFLYEYHKEYRKNNKDRIYARVNHRRALKKASPGQYTAEEANAILEAQRHRCANCKADLRKVARHIDHIIPLSRGGSNDKSNIQWLCKPCNLSKHAKDPIQFAQEQGRLL
jgi:5-methylcytosine-specific restriction endonuclease McrA